MKSDKLRNPRSKILSVRKYLTSNATCFKIGNCQLSIVNYFTLVELLVVITIISILASILLPALKTAKDISRASVCGGNMKQLGYAWSYYSGDYDDWLLSLCADANRFGGAGCNSLSSNFWPYVVRDYLNMPNMPDGYWGGVPAKYAWNSVITCPSMNNGKKYMQYLFEIHYTMPQYNIGGDDKAGDSIVAYRKIHQMKYPSNQCVFLETSGGVNTNPTGYSGNVWVQQTYWTSLTSGHMDFRHNRSANVMFGDVHVERRTQQNILSEIAPAWKTSKFFGCPP